MVLFLCPIQFIRKNEVPDIMGKNGHAASCGKSQLLFIVLSASVELKRMRGLISSASKHFREQYSHVFIKIQ